MIREIGNAIVVLVLMMTVTVSQLQAFRDERAEVTRNLFEPTPTVFLHKISGNNQSINIEPIGGSQGKPTKTIANKPASSPLPGKIPTAVYVSNKKPEPVIPIKTATDNPSSSVNPRRRMPINVITNKNSTKRSLEPSTSQAPLTIYPSQSPSFQPSLNPTKAPVTLHPTRNPSFQPSFMPSALPSAKPSAHPSSPPTSAPSKAPSSSYFITGSTVFYLSSVPSVMDNETQKIFNDTTWKFTVSFLSNASIISNQDGLVDFHLQVNMAEDDANLTRKLLFQTKEAIKCRDTRQLYVTLKVNVTVVVKLIPSFISSMTNSTIDLLLSSAVLSPAYIETIQRNATSGFFSKASIYSTSFTAELQTNAMKQQEDESINSNHDSQEPQNRQNYGTIIALSVVSTLLVVVVLSVAAFFFYSKRIRAHFNVNRNDAVYGASKGESSQKHEKIEKENVTGDGEGEKQLVLCQDEVYRRNGDSSFDQTFLPYHVPSLNSTSTCKEADPISGNQSANTTIILNAPGKKLAASSKWSSYPSPVHSTIPPLILLDGLEESDDNKQGNAQYLLPECTAGKHQYPRIRRYDSSPCNSSLSNSPATAYTLPGVASVEPNCGNNENDAAQGAARKRLVLHNPAPGDLEPSTDQGEAYIKNQQNIMLEYDQLMNTDRSPREIQSREQYQLQQGENQRTFINKTETNDDEKSYSNTYKEDPIVEPLDGFDLESYYSKSSKGTKKKSSRSQRHRVKRTIPGKIYKVEAPLSGKLGLTIDSTENHGPPTIREIKNYSPLFGLVQLGDSIIMIEEYETDEMNSGQITQLLSHLRKTRTDGFICITVIRPAKTSGGLGDSTKAANYHFEQDYQLERNDTIEEDFIMTVDSAEEIPMPEHRQNFLVRTTEPISEGEEEESVEESIHLLGSLENEESLSYYHNKDYEKMLKSLENSSEHHQDQVILVDEREPPCFDSRHDEEGAENSFHLLGGLNRGSFDYDDDGQESL